MSAFFIKTACQNLWRYKNGTFYVRVRVGGRKEVMRSLGTKKFSVAKAKLPKELNRILGERQRMDRGEFLLGECAEMFLAQKRAKGIKPGALRYREETVEMLRRTWPGFDETKAAEVTVLDCKAWAVRVREMFSPRTNRRYSSTRVNGMIESLRGIFGVVLQGGAIERNPAMQVERIRVKRKQWELPSPEQFREVMARLEAMKSRRRAALTVKFIVFSGQRPSAAAQVTAADVDLERNEISFPPIKHQENRLVVPMSKALREVVEELMSREGGKSREQGAGRKTPLLPIKNPRRALATVCRELGIERLNRNALRHLFTTHCLERGMDVADVARLRGDKDGGAMLLKNYSHPRQDHLQKEVAKVEW